MDRTADAERFAAEIENETKSKKPPYLPSWVDWVTDRVKQLPIPVWLLYLVLGLALVLLHAAIKWSEGAYPAGTFFPFHLVLNLSPVVVMAMMYYFDDWAETALATFRPAMSIEEAEYEKVRYQLTTLPRLQTFIASFIGLAYGLIYLILLITPQQKEQYKVFRSPTGSVLDVTLELLNYLLYAILFYHTVHQMRIISRIYSTYTHVDLFQLGPLHAFSTLAARIAISIAIMTYAWIYAFSGSANISDTLTPALAIPLLFATFILPLMGIHRILQQEKGKLQSENALHLKAALAELHHRREAGDYGQIDGVSKAIDALTKEQSLLDKISTWPWQPETVRWVGTALLLPVILTLATRVLQRFLGF